MALDADVLRRLRQELGSSTEAGVDDDATLETVFNDEGESSILVTALVVWRHRLGNLTNRSFDVSTEGSLLSRSQRIRFIERKIFRLENLVETTLKGTNMALQTPAEQEEAAVSTTTSLYGGEFSS